MRWFGSDKKKAKGTNVAPLVNNNAQPMSSTTVQQAWQNPRGLRPEQVQQFQSTMGNRSVNYLLGKHRADNDNLTPNRYQLTMAVQAGDENFISQSTKFTINKFGRRIGLPLPKMTAPRGTGHAWVVIKALHENILLDDSSYGFTPGGFREPDPYAGSSGEGVIYKDHEISQEAYERIQARLQNIKERSESGELKYNVLGYNCTAFVRDIAKTAKVPFAGSKVLPFAFHGPASAFTPNKLHKALRKQKKKKGSKLRDHPLPKNILVQGGGGWFENMLERARARRAAANGGVVDPAQEARLARLAALMNTIDNDNENDNESVNDTTIDSDTEDSLEDVMERRVEEDSVEDSLEEDSLEDAPVGNGLSEEMRAQLMEQFGIEEDDEEMLESETEQQIEEAGPSNTQSQVPTTEKKTTIAALLDMLDEEGIESELEEDEEEEQSYQEDEESEEELG